MSRNDWVVSQTIFLFPLLALVGLSSSAAYALGFVRLDSSGFLRHDAERGDSASTVMLGPEFNFEGHWLTGELDLKGVAFLSDRNSFTVEAGSAFVATSPQWMPHHQISLGRRVYDWSMMEDEWSLGLWSARFLWNPLKPERVGLTGAFYTYESNHWRILGFATPLSVPERSYPIRESGGQLTSASPDYVPPYNQLALMNQNIPFHYTIQYPPMQELLFRPGAGVQVRYGGKEGFWTAGSYGLMPMHQIQLAAEAHIDSRAGYVDAVIHPRTLFHHLITGESGYRGQLWSVWSSVSGEAPIQRPLPSDWVADPMGPALLTSAGADMRLDSFFTLSASYMGVDENKPPIVPDAVPMNMPSRFEYSRAVQLEGRWTGIPEITSDLHWIYDLDNVSSLVSLDLFYQPQRRHSGLLHGLFGGDGVWTFGVGADGFASASGTGYIGQFIGNDRVRGRISYAF